MMFVCSGDNQNCNSMTHSSRCVSGIDTCQNYRSLSDSSKNEGLSGINMVCWSLEVFEFREFLYGTSYKGA